MIGFLEQQLLAWIEQAYQLMGWPGVVALMALESACIPIPSEIIMPLAGWMLVKNQGLGMAYVVLAGFWGAVGCTLGSALAYWAGTHGGRTFLEKHGKYLLITHHDLALADRWFAKYGTATAFFSRLLPIVRTFISLPAGISRMPWGKFLLYSFLGSFPWCFALAYGGYLLGEHWEQVRNAIRPFEIPMALAILALIVLYIYRHLRSQTTTKNP